MLYPRMVRVQEVVCVVDEGGDGQRWRNSVISYARFLSCRQPQATKSLRGVQRQLRDPGQSGAGNGEEEMSGRERRGQAIVSNKHTSKHLPALSVSGVTLACGEVV